MTSSDTLPRRIELDGPVNFRDLGGYVGRDAKTVAWRQVFRADGLDSMTRRDLDIVAGQLGVATVIDLRTPREIELIGLGPVAQAGLSWHNVSIIDETQRLWQQALDHGTIVEQYFVMLDGSSARFVEALELIAAAEGPLVFHCAAGKDRTGLLAALLLSLLEVDDPTIGADYALTAEVLPAIEAKLMARAEDPRFRDHYAKRPNWKQAARRALTADGDTLAVVMTEWRERHGSVEAWLSTHGMHPTVPERLRQRLLV